MTSFAENDCSSAVEKGQNDARLLGAIAQEKIGIIGKISKDEGIAATTD
ncbi:hypothetical protein NB640_01735 [Oxalobacter vibrioformis]|uniref:Uncharacterized protein n=1 Tax=Oxalobacter vibrioformis TaxID=933080 RepID=A0A9E9LXB4_9BURK|nr:hypothetical protein [Oxalobacter vibrioformis]WAW10412.1 hypothetical protein NB640_01735 [Oxalobacter vibrioformis]